jgi:hypothetical protein
LKFYCCKGDDDVGCVGSGAIATRGGVEAGGSGSNGGAAGAVAILTSHFLLVVQFYGKGCLQCSLQKVSLKRCVDGLILGNVSADGEPNSLHPRSCMKKGLAILKSVYEP